MVLKAARDSTRKFTAWYTRMRAMPWRVALRYLSCQVRGQTEPERFSVLGFDIFLRPGSTDLKVACESLGQELEPAISYLPEAFDGVIVDAGGYIGTSALKLARAFPRARIFVLEPNDNNHAMILRNVAGIENIIPLKLALSNRSGAGQLKDRLTGNWGFTIVDRPCDTPGARSMSEIQTISVPDFITEHGITDIGLFKIDIEGAEALLFEAPEAWLGHTDLLIIELHEFIVPGVEARFREITRGRATMKLPGEKRISIRRT